LVLIVICLNQASKNSFSNCFAKVFLTIN